MHSQYLNTFFDEESWNMFEEFSYNKTLSSYSLLPILLLMLLMCVAVLNGKQDIDTFINIVTNISTVMFALFSILYYEIQL